MKRKYPVSARRWLAAQPRQKAYLKDRLMLNSGRRRTTKRRRLGRRTGRKYIRRYTYSKGRKYRRRSGKRATPIIRSVRNSIMPETKTMKFFWHGNYQITSSGQASGTYVPISVFQPYFPNAVEEGETEAVNNWSHYCDNNYGTPKYKQYVPNACKITITLIPQPNQETIANNLGATANVAPDFMPLKLRLGCVIGDDTNFGLSIMNDALPWLQGYRVKERDIPTGGANTRKQRLSMYIKLPEGDRYSNQPNYYPPIDTYQAPNKALIAVQTNAWSAAARNTHAYFYWGVFNQTPATNSTRCLADVTLTYYVTLTDMQQVQNFTQVS